MTGWSKTPQSVVSASLKRCSRKACRQPGIGGAACQGAAAPKQSGGRVKMTGRPFVKRRKKTGGRQKGVQNKMSIMAREVIEQAAAELGGMERLVAWVREAPENERVFWSTMYTKLLPMQVVGYANNPVSITVSWKRPDRPAGLLEADRRSVAVLENAPLPKYSN
jgi:hypothetical protein